MSRGKPSTYEVRKQAQIIAVEVGPMRRHDLVMLIASRCGCSYDLANSAVNTEVDDKFIIKNNKNTSELAALRAELARVKIERNALAEQLKQYQRMAARK